MRSSAMSEVFFALCKSLDTARSLSAWLQYKYGEHTQLARMAIHPSHYCSDSQTYVRDLAVLALVQKYKGLETGLDLEGEALTAFADSEVRCKTSNDRIQSWLSGETPEPAFISKVRRKIARILGPVRHGEIAALSKWGNGATSSVKRREAYRDLKISETPIRCSSFACMKLLKAHLESDWHWFESVSGHDVGGEFSVLSSCFVIDPTCVVTTVPKKATTDRTIGQEPTGSGFIQQGIGRFIRLMLLKAGVDLSNQEINQTWASLAHDLGLATVDLKSASDTVAALLVLLLLPLEWVSLLQSARSAYALIARKGQGREGGTHIELEKFSSMGNAYTFELETLIFYAVAKVATEEVGGLQLVSVYGDDIILPAKAAPRLYEMLDVLGFIPNKDKSFTEGHFYESCGGQYWRGKDVTPAYQKDPLPSGIQRRDKAGKQTLDLRATQVVLRCANRLLRRAGGHSDVAVSSGYLRARAALLREYRIVPTSFSLILPPWAEGDDGLLLSIEEWEPHRQRLVGTTDHRLDMGFQVKTIRSRPMPRSLGKPSDTAKGRSRRSAALDNARSRVAENGRAKLAWYLRRSVIANHGFADEVSPDILKDTEDRLSIGRRWIAPAGSFGD